MVKYAGVSEGESVKRRLKDAQEEYNGQLHATGFRRRIRKKEIERVF